MVRGWTWPSILLVTAWGVAATARAESVEHVADALLARWAPVYVQHVDSDDRGADRPTQIDFDGNWDATDNWDHQAERGTALPPAAYGAAILTTTHAYLTYTLFYPRDWSRFCLPFVCHDNDLETVQLVIARDTGDGTLERVTAKAHRAMTATSGEAIARSPDGRPLLRVEPQGHGIAVCRPEEPACHAHPGRLIYVPGRPPSPPPPRPLGQRIGYELLRLHDTLWLRRGRSQPGLWTDGETGPLYYHGRYRGRLGHAMGAAMATSRYLGGVRPPWALAGRSGRRGDWFLDPAAETDPAATYVYNPFLDDLAAECSGPQCVPAPPERTRLAYYADVVTELGAPYLAFALGTVLLTGLRRSRRALAGS